MMENDEIKRRTHEPSAEAKGAKPVTREEYPTIGADELEVEKRVVNSGQQLASGGGERADGGRYSLDDADVTRGERIAYLENQNAINDGRLRQLGAKPDKFEGDTMDELLTYYKGLLADKLKRQESNEDRKRRERSERTQQSLSAVGDLLGAWHRAWAYGRGVKPMELPDMSEKTRARIEKAKAAREKNESEILDLMSGIERLQRARRNQDYKEESLELRRKSVEAKMQEYQAKINRLVKQGETEQARQLMLEAQAELYKAKADGVKINNDYLAEFNEAKIAEKVHNANRPYGSSGGKGSSDGKGSSEDKVKVTEKTETDALGRPKTTTTRQYVEAKGQSGSSKKSQKSTTKKPYIGFSIHK